MPDRVQKTRAPWQPPQWLLEAAKKRSGVPNQAFLEKLQYARENPDEVERKAREDAVRSGRDPDGFVKVMAEMRKTASRMQLAQRPKEVRAEVVAEEMQSATDITMGQYDTSSLDFDMQTSPAPPSPGGRTAMQDTQRSLPPSPRTQRRSTAKGKITKTNQSQKRDERNASEDKARMKQRKSENASSASGTASPAEVDNIHYIPESSASGAVRETRIAAARVPESPISPATDSAVQPYRFPARRIMPAWYTSISAQAQGLSQLDRRRPQELAAIDALKDCIRRCEQETNKSRLGKEYNDLRNHVHKAEIKLDMDKFKVKKTRILTEAGLPRIFKVDAHFPWDLKADAWYLYERWMNEDFEQDILRGIVTVKGKDRNGDRLDRAYTSKHPRDPKYFGDEGVVLGQWWPSQLCTVRDGVHGAAQGGIYGDKEKGAYSIVLSGGGYHDQDEGDTIEYSGTDGKNYQATDATLSMIKSTELGNHIRVIRSSQLLKSNKFRPSCGLRYDGLYQIKSYKEIDNQKRTYRFRLERVPGQEPIRFEGVAKRPTLFEEEAYDKCKGRI